MHYQILKQGLARIFLTLKKRTQDLARKENADLNTGQRGVYSSYKLILHARKTSPRKNDVQKAKANA